MNKLFRHHIVGEEESPFERFSKRDGRYDRPSGVEQRCVYLYQLLILIDMLVIENIPC